MKSLSYLKRIRNALRHQSGLTIARKDLFKIIEIELHSASLTERNAKSSATLILAEAHLNLLYLMKSKVKKQGVLGALLNADFPQDHFLMDLIGRAGVLVKEEGKLHPYFFLLRNFGRRFSEDGLVIFQEECEVAVNLKAHCPGKKLLQISEFVFSKKFHDQICRQIVADMREEYREALFQNRIWKARWVRIRGTWSFFAAIGLDRAFAFVSFFVKAWKSVN
jgi:hypothetical protein